MKYREAVIIRRYGGCFFLWILCSEKIKRILLRIYYIFLTLIRAYDKIEINYDVKT